jgi:hypothetical protein
MGEEKFIVEDGKKKEEAEVRASRRIIVRAPAPRRGFLPTAFTVDRSA